MAFACVCAYFKGFVSGSNRMGAIPDRKSGVDREDCTTDARGYHDNTCMYKYNKIYYIQYININAYLIFMKYFLPFCS